VHLDRHFADRQLVRNLLLHEAGNRLAVGIAEDERTAELLRIDDELEALQRTEESLIEAAFANGVDVLRRGHASPEAVLGVRLPRPAAPAAKPSQRQCQGK
jgi:hypothetical protein